MTSPTIPDAGPKPPYYELIDNSKTGRREQWINGKLTGVASAWTFDTVPFGSYPDLPDNYRRPDEACAHKRLLDAARNILILEERFQQEGGIPYPEVEPFYAELRAAVDELTRKTT